MKKYLNHNLYLIPPICQEWTFNNFSSSLCWTELTEKRKKVSELKNEICPVIGRLFLANGISGCGIMSPWKQELLRLYVTNQPENAGSQQTVSGVCSVSSADTEILQSTTRSAAAILREPADIKVFLLSIGTDSGFLLQKRTNVETVNMPAVIWQDGEWSSPQKTNRNSLC